MAGVNKKVYYRISFKTASALSLGGNSSIASDKDIVRNGADEPYIPASSLAGVYRNLFDEKTAEHYFGKCAGSDMAESRITVCDARLMGRAIVSKRDCVGLDEWKTGIEGAKFNFEVLEPGASFVTLIEQDIYGSDEDVSAVIAEEWLNGGIRLGGKTTRGLGRMKDAAVKRREFSFEDGADIDEWLEFDPFDEAAWNSAEEWQSADGRRTRQMHIRLEMRQKSPVSVRTYSTEVNRHDEKNGAVYAVPDSVQLVYKRNGGEIPVIPGTSWAGAFRHHIERLGIKDTGKYFGSISMRSSVVFGESEITNAYPKTVSRSSVDRFTGGVIRNALFTEKFYCGGETELEIMLDRYTDREFISALAAAVADLHAGFLSVGGETSIGHGLFELTAAECEGKSIAVTDSAAIYDGLLRAMLDESEG